MDAEFLCPPRWSEPDLAAERALHEARAAHLAAGFCGRRREFAVLDAHAEGESDDAVVVTGEPGVGKSALLSAWARSYAARNPGRAIVTHFPDVSAASSHAPSALLRLWQEIERALRFECPLPETGHRLAWAFGSLLQRAGEAGRLVLLIDAVELLADTKWCALPLRTPLPSPRTCEVFMRQPWHALAWLPGKWPLNIRLIYTTSDEESLDVLVGLGARPLTLGPLDAATALDVLVEGLRVKRGPAPRKALVVLPDLLAGKRPLFVRAMLDELVSCADADDALDWLRRMPGSLPELFEAMLQRLAVRSGQRASALAWFLAALSMSRHGLTATELGALGPPDSECSATWPTWRDCAPALSTWVRHEGPFVRLGHEEMGQAIGALYLPLGSHRREVHRALARLFASKLDGLPGDGPASERRRLTELPHHMTEASQWPGLRELFTDPDFLERRCRTTGPHALLGDLRRALASGFAPEQQPAVELVRDALTRAGRTLCRHPELLGQELLNQLVEHPPEAGSLPLPLSAWRRRAEERAGRWVRVLHPVGLSRRDEEVSAMASAQPSTCRLAADGSRALVTFGTCSVRLVDVASGADLWSRLEGDLEAYDVRFAERDRRVLMLPWKARVRVLDGDTGQTLEAGLNVPVGWVLHRFTADGRHLVAAYPSGAVRLLRFDGTWASADLPRGDWPAPLAAVSADGRRAVFQTASDRLALLELPGCRKLCDLGHSGLIRGVAVSSEGPRAATAAQDGTLRIWDLSTGEALHVLRGNGEVVTACALSQDGNRAVSSGLDGTLRFWDLTSGESLGLYVRSWAFNDCSLDAAGRLAAAVTPDGSLELVELMEPGEGCAVGRRRQGQPGPR